MSDRDRASRLRQEIGHLAAEGDTLQRRMLHPKRMIRASLIARRLGSSHRKRASTAYYLSWAERRKTVLRHVAKEDLARVRARVDSWREYRRRFRRCRQIAQRLLELFDQLGEVQSERPGAEAPR